MLIISALLLVLGTQAEVKPLKEILTLDGDKGPITLSMCPGRYEGVVSFGARYFCYEGKPQFPGPTIEITQGNTLTIVLKNDMEPNPNIPEAEHNHMGSADTTNLHTHGLHVAPQEDNVCTKIGPGETFTYTYHIRDDHYPGTHWYHPHLHGSATLQVGGCMHGLLLVKPKSSRDWPAELKNMVEHRVVISDLEFSGWGRGQASNPGPDYEFFANKMNASASVPLNVIVSEPALASVLVVNGEYQPVVAMEVGKPAYFRILMATVTSMVELMVHDPRNEGKCRFVRLAFDGVFHDEPVPITAIILPQGGRADVVIQCDGKPGLYHVSSRASPKRDMLLGRRYRFHQENVWSLLVSPGTPNPSSTLVQASSIPTKPAYLDSLLDKPLSGSWRVGLRHSPEWNSPDGARQGFAATVNGKKFTNCDNPSYEMNQGSTYEFTFEGFADVWRLRHPYHQHINHFQITSLGKDYVDTMRGDTQQQLDNIGKVGEWRDTMTDLPDARFRVRPMHYTGAVIMHCHILAHEDEGMMTTFQVRLASKYAGCHYVENLAQKDCEGTRQHHAATTWSACQAECCQNSACKLWLFYDDPAKGCQLGIGHSFRPRCSAKGAGTSIAGEIIGRSPTPGRDSPAHPYCVKPAQTSQCSGSGPYWDRRCDEFCTKLPGDCHHVAWHICAGTPLHPKYRCSCQCCGDPVWLRGSQLTASQSSVFKRAVASRAVDGDRRQTWSSRTCQSTHRERNPWLRIDLGKTYLAVLGLRIWGGTDCCPAGSSDLEIYVGDDGTHYANNQKVKTGFNAHVHGGASASIDGSGRYVFVVKPGKSYLYICEVEVRVVNTAPQNAVTSASATEDAAVASLVRLLAADESSHV